MGNSEVPIEQLHTDLLHWWNTNSRNFPWRDTRNPFHILISEIMLRRTRAEQVVPVYVEFVSKYPDPQSLKNADAKEIETLLYSLGLAWRVPAFQQIANHLCQKFDGRVPTQYSDLLSLPGVGDYVASAVCCFAFDQPIMIVDTNTVRVIGRIYGTKTHAESRRDKRVRELVKTTLNSKNPRKHNYALLDLAAKVCLPHKPQCNKCPLSNYCAYHQQLKITEL